MTVPRRTLGQTGLSLPVIGFGCGPTAGLIVKGDGAAQHAAVARALELGIDFFDTAPLYGNGQSERALGAILRELGAAPLIATKVLLSEADLQNIGEAVARSVEASCERLGQSPITLVLLHNRIAGKRQAKAQGSVGPLLGLDDMLGAGGVGEAFARLRERGVVRYLGCSAYGGEMPAVARVIDAGTFDCLSVHYSLLNPTAWTHCERAANGNDYACIGAHAAAAGMGVIALRVLEAGLLAGGERGAADSRIRALSGMLDPAQSATEAALRFVLSQDAVTTALVGFSNAVHVEAAASYAAQGALPDALQSRIAAWQTNPLERILD